MAQVVLDSKFSRREFPLEPFIEKEKVSEDITKVLSHLLVWSDSLEQWLKARGDVSGRLMISAPGLATKHAYNSISASDSETTVDLGEKYTTHLIINDGPNSVYVNFDATATTSSIEIKAGEVLRIDYEFKVLHVICASGETASVRWIALK